MEVDELRDLLYKEYVKNKYEELWNNPTPDQIRRFADLAELCLVNSEIAEASEIIRENFTVKQNLKIIKMCRERHVTRKEAIHILLGNEIADAVTRLSNFAKRKKIDLTVRLLETNIENLKREILHGLKS